MATIYWHGRSFEDSDEFERAYTDHCLAQFTQMDSPHGPLLVAKELPQDKMALIQACVEASAGCANDPGSFVAAVARAFESGGWRVYDPVASLIFASVGGHPGLKLALEMLLGHKSAKVRQRLLALIAEDVEAEIELITRETKLDLLKRLLQDRSAVVRTLAVDRLLDIGNCYRKTDNEILSTVK